MNNNYVTNSSVKSKKVMLILCIVLGFFGIHDFYAGNFGKGIIKMFTANIFCIGWLVDIIKILSNTYLDGAKMPINRW